MRVEKSRGGVWTSALLALSCLRSGDGAFTLLLHALSTTNYSSLLTAPLPSIKAKPPKIPPPHKEGPYSSPIATKGWYICPLICLSNSSSLIPLNPSFRSTPNLCAERITPAAIAIDTSLIRSTSGYRRWRARSSSVSESARACAEACTISSGICRREG